MPSYYWIIAQAAMDSGFPKYEVLEMVVNRQIGKRVRDIDLCRHYDNLPSRQTRYWIECRDLDGYKRSMLYCEHENLRIRVVFHIEPKRNLQ